MATQITNQARLTYAYGQSVGTAASNIATTMLQGPLSAVKNSIDPDYRYGSELTYIVTVSNTGLTAFNNVTVTDDLGEYAISATQNAVPLTYTGPAQLYINGVFSANLTPTTTDEGIVFTIPSIASGANAMLIYQATVNTYAPLASGSSIRNIATIAAPGLSESVNVGASVPVEDYADVHITKTMSPNPVTGGATLTYAFTIYNYGNTDAMDVVLSDPFSPAPTAITVTVDGTALDAADFDYSNGVLTLPAAASAYALSIPAATFAQDAATGEYTINPGTVAIEVTGTL